MPSGICTRVGQYAYTYGATIPITMPSGSFFVFFLVLPRVVGGHLQMQRTTTQRIRIPRVQ